MYRKNGLCVCRAAKLWTIIVIHFRSITQHVNRLPILLIPWMNKDSLFRLLESYRLMTYSHPFKCSYF